MGHRFEGKVVLVTGASRGIGKETALAFAREGASLVLAARSPEPLEEVTAAVRARDAAALAVTTGVANLSSVMGRKAFAGFGSYAIVMHAVSAFSDALRQELAGVGIRASAIHPALTATDLLRDADETMMPPPFCHVTPMSAESVGRADFRGQRRLVPPRMANMLLVAEAVSPWLGDLVARALTVRAIAGSWG
jgi:NAD(P)-dependent dehydrogenase (short-subunit alcohol dehydrogenase family)